MAEPEAEAEAAAAVAATAAAASGTSPGMAMPSMGAVPGMDPAQYSAWLQALQAQQAGMTQMWRPNAHGSKCNH